MLEFGEREVVVDLVELDQGLQGKDFLEFPSLAVDLLQHLREILFSLQGLENILNYCFSYV